MAISSSIRDVFGYFQNLNLLALLEDLHAGRTTRNAWLSGSLLCPVAHGLPAGRLVENLSSLGPTASLGHECDYAGRQLGADTRSIMAFVQAWDEGLLSDDCLARQLEDLWAERLEDAEALQALLGGLSPKAENEVESEELISRGT